MNYYNKIKNKIIDIEIYKKVKDYSKNKRELEGYYRIGKLIIDAQGGEEKATYGNKLIREYSDKLTNELSKKYSVRYLFDIRRLYLFSKVHPLDAQLTLWHYRLLFSLSDKNKINYYINQIKKYNLSKRQLQEKIKSKEYERLDESVKEKLIEKEENKINDFIKHPILIKNQKNYESISEKILQNLILEDILHFLKELGEGFTFIENEYRIKIRENYNYIDLLLYNIIYNYYIVVELKTTELKKEHIGQIQVYMNYIDRNVKTINQNKSIGIIICKRENEFILEYCSDSRIYETTYMLINENI